MNRSSTQRAVYVDPPYPAYYDDKLFDRSDPVLGRDGTLEPWWRLRNAVTDAGCETHTADYLLVGAGNRDREEADYYSLGILKNYRSLNRVEGVRLRAFLIFEPPVVAPQLYRALPHLSSLFERVYVHNIEGDGYSLKDVDRSRLKKLYWPQPYADVLSPFWENPDRQKRLVVVNANHIPRSFTRQLYSKRIEAMTALARFGAVDLYGRGWAKWWSHRSMWPPYWLNLRTLMLIYRGSCDSKYAVLSRYSFSLCFENMAMKGYVTEKLFDCLYAGTIPVYLGATDIENLMPHEIYIDARKYGSWRDLWESLQSMTNDQVRAMREAGRDYVRSEAMKKYYDSLLGIFQPTTDNPV